MNNNNNNNLSRSSKRRFQRRGRNNGTSMGRPHGPLDSPPMFNATFQNLRKVIRFSAPNAAPSSSPSVISTLDLFNLLLVQVTTSDASPIIAALRLRRASIWVGSPSTAVATNCSIEFSISNTPGNVGVKPTVFADTSVSAAVPAFVTAKPPKNSACDAWQFRPASVSTGGTSLIFIHSANAIIDITLDVVFQNGETPTLVNVPGTVIGRLFLNTLDNTTSNQIVPDPSQAS
jgi:hypothetical protein